MRGEQMRRLFIDQQSDSRTWTKIFNDKLSCLFFRIRLTYHVLVWINTKLYSVWFINKNFKKHLGHFIPPIFFSPLVLQVNCGFFGIYTFAWNWELLETLVLGFPFHYNYWIFVVVITWFVFISFIPPGTNLCLNVTFLPSLTIYSDTTGFLTMFSSTLSSYLMIITCIYVCLLVPPHEFKRSRLSCSVL